MEAKLAKESAEKDEQEATEKAAKEAAEKEAAEAAEKEKAEKEAEVAQKTESEKSVEVALTQGESSTTDLASLVIRTLEELQKEQQMVRTRIDKQDQVNNSIHNLLVELLQRMPPPPKP